VADRLLSAIQADLDLPAQSRVAVMVNGLGATPLEELYILYRQVHKSLAQVGVTIHRAFVGEYATSLEMAGASLTVLRLDDELAAYLDAPAESPFFVQTDRRGR
jgi:dihydroxyacetone kinase